MRKNLAGNGIIFVIITMILTFSWIHPVQAQSIIPDGQVPSGQKIDNDIIVFGDNVSIDANINGDVIAVGNNIRVTGDISGNLIAIGRDLYVDNRIGGSLYSLGLNNILKTNTQVTRNLYYVGIRLETMEGSNIGRDLVAAALRAQLSGSVGRDIRAVIGLLEFVDIIREGVEETIPDELQTPAEPGDTQDSEGAFLPHQEFSYPPSITQFISFTDGIFSPEVIDTSQRASTMIQQAGTGEIDTELLLAWLAARGKILIAFLIVGGLLIWLLPGWLLRWADNLKLKPWASGGYGILGLVLALNGFIVIGVSVMIFLAIGLGLGVISLWRLAFYFWGISFSTLTLAAFLFAIFVFYISKIIVAFITGKLILQRFLGNSAVNKILSLLLGSIIVVLLTGIPYVGWVISLVISALGLGATFLGYQEYRREKNPPAKSA
jgi:hypothetical protein